MDLSAVPSGVLVGLLTLQLSVAIHIVFVSTTLGVGVITALYRTLAVKRSDPFAEVFARRSFRIMIVSELFSGVWGTIITVILAGFFPGLVALATNVLFTPIAVSIASILIRIPSIAIFWYTWGRIKPETHMLIGWIMALSGFGIPLGFRTLFSEITHPQAVGLYLSSGHVDPLTAYSNPVYWPLFLHTIFATISLGGFIIASLETLTKDVRGVSIGVRFGLIFLVAQLFAGPLYWYTLHYYSSYIFQNVTFGDFTPVFIIKMILVATLLIVSTYTWALTSKLNTIPRSTWSLGLIAAAIVVLGEIVNDSSRYPYIVVTGDTGISATAFSNFYMDIPLSVVYIILGFLIFSIIVFGLAAYYAFVKMFVREIPEEIEEKIFK
ncbi:MAG: cytochrome ubiquinol oxidase subunit I [Desulfurococcales archaeon]|nr:cytochrome ubiquinol oxidase subunit I [Desulfurococcales archaeon]